MRLAALRVKMATGSGKTKVLSLALAWSFFHKLYEPERAGAQLPVIAPNIIVLDRIYKDFQGLRIFFEDPVIPDNGFDGPQLARRLSTDPAHAGRGAHHPAPPATSS
jgi:hypothetical protein